MYQEWGERPPVHEAFAVFIGIKNKKKKYGDLSELVNLFPGTVVKQPKRLH